MKRKKKCVEEKGREKKIMSLIGERREGKNSCMDLGILKKREEKIITGVVKEE